MAAEFNPMDSLFVNPVVAERTRKVLYESLHGTATPLQQYANGGMGANFQMTLGSAYLKITEKRDEKSAWNNRQVISEELHFSQSGKNFATGSVTLLMMKAAVEAGDKAGEPVKIKDVKEAIRTVTEPTLRDLYGGRSYHFYAEAIRSRIVRYALFGRERKSKRNYDEFKLGYTIKDNANIVIL